MTFTKRAILLYPITISLILAADCLMETLRASATGPDPGSLACLGIGLVLVWAFTALAHRLRLQDLALRDPAGREPARSRGHGRRSL